MDMKMLSRVGKSTDERYSSLKNKNQILSGERKKFIVRSSFLKPKKDPDANFLERIRLIQSKNLPDPKQLLTNNKNIMKKNDSPKKNRKHRNSVDDLRGKQSSFRAISRGTYYKINSVKDLPPPCGYYNINYELVDKSIPTKNLQRYQQRKTQFLIKKDNLDIDYPDIKRLDKQKGYIDFKKISPRGAFETLQANTPHEKQFDNFNYFPSISSKSGNKIEANFTTLRSREPNFKINMTPSVYEPNHEFLKSSLSKTGIAWNKLLPRPPIISPRKEIDLNSSSIDFDKAIAAKMSLMSP
ncbi:unnamed protein product [Moneuplotes crassus]|uniref:Uncharacterized protein n=1 Tax=Euplotes crassus TaxID=5936 RepID=A0AAD1XM02_EUPCR|nr:unnamed protein product [Moneuplotes crassus]